MSEDEDFDELPSIEVNSALSQSSSFVMPSAEAVASARAREAFTEDELRRLRRDQPLSDNEVCLLATSDSSGSEGEAALAAAAAALRVASPPAPAPAPAPALAAITAFLEHAPPRAASLLQHNAELARALSPEDFARITDEMVEEAAAVVEGAEGAEALGAAGWLCALAAGGARRRTGRAAARVLHVAVERADAAALDAWLESAAPALSADAALRLCSALAAGCGARGGAAARATARGALTALGEWRALAAGRRYVALQLVARLAAVDAPDGAAARRCLTSVATAPHERALGADTLKVLVTAAKMQVLFHVRE